MLAHHHTGKGSCDTGVADHDLSFGCTGRGSACPSLGGVEFGRGQGMLFEQLLGAREIGGCLSGQRCGLIAFGRDLAGIEFHQHGAGGDGLPEMGHVVVVTVGAMKVGFIVDHLVGQEEVVIKPLGAMLQGTKGLSGATITGDGRIALILDVPELMRAYARHAA